MAKLSSLVSIYETLLNKYKPLCFCFFIVKDHIIENTEPPVKTFGVEHIQK